MKKNKKGCYLIVIIIVPFFMPVAYIFPQSVNSIENPSEQDSTSYISSKFSGYAALRYKVRHVEGQGGSDQDFYQSLSLNYGNPYQDKISAYLYGTLRQDIDDPSAFFRSIDDTYDISLRSYLYEFYGDIRDIGIIEDVKIGRQYDYNVESLHFDGVHLSFSPFYNIRLGAYGGRPVHFFESNHDGDWISGISLETAPIQGSTLRFDYIFAADNNDDLGDHQDNLIIFNAWQKIFAWWQIYGRYSRLDSISRDIQLRSSWDFPLIDLDIQFSYYKQPETLDDFTVEFDEFTPLAGDYAPFDQYTLDIYKGIGTHMGVNLGFSLRKLKDESDEAEFNHDFERFYITYSIFNLPWKGLTWSLTGEDYETPGDDIQTVGFDITQDLDKKVKLSLGSYYSLYKFDTTVSPDSLGGIDIGGLPSPSPFLSESLTESERDNVRAYYLKVKKKISDHWEIGARYEYERFDSDTFHTFETALRFKF